MRNNEDNQNLQFMLLANKKENIEETSNSFQIHSQNLNLNQQNSYHNVMLESILFRPSDSFSIDRNQLKTLNESRVLSFSNKINMPNTSKNSIFMNQIKNIMETKSLSENYNLGSKTQNLNRLINSTPERILDAPNLLDDYYLNLLDWSSQNELAVSLGNSVYLWNGNNYETLQLMTSSDIICSVSWMNSGNCLGIGLKDGNIELWDTVKLTQIRNMSGHTDRVCSLSWNNYMLSSGSKDTRIINHDVRIRNQHIHNLVGHTQEVCALKWSPDGSLLASGGNDNMLHIWDINNLNSHQLGRNRSNSHANFNVNSNLINSNFNSNLNNNQFNHMNSLNNMGGISSNLGHQLNNRHPSLWNNEDSNLQSNNQSTHPIDICPKYSFSGHDAAVKALAWCPWQKGLLASGAGNKDKTIKFWNTETGSLINSIDTGSQVCALLWSKHEKELISSHGFSKHQISIWKYPSMYKVTELNGHMSRVLYLCMSPDGNTIVSGAGDETLRFWKIGDNKKSTSSDPLELDKSNKFMNNFQIR